MKNLIILIATLVFTSQARAQTQQLEPSNAMNLDFFVGTWKYENDQISETFTLRLRKVCDTSNNVIYEAVAGAYTHFRLDRRGVNCMNEFFSTSKSPVSMPVYATNDASDRNAVNPNKLRMFVTDYGLRAPNGEAKRMYKNELLIVSKDTPNQIRWILKDELDGEMLTEEVPPPGFTLPTDIILRKVADE